MKDHVRVRLKYVELVRAGKLAEAQKVLESIWARKPVSKLVETQVKDIVTIEPAKNKSINDLIYIKGIGKKTIKDINTMFKTMSDLIDALKNDKVALRDDIVEKLKEELI